MDDFLVESQCDEFEYYYCEDPDYYGPYDQPLIEDQYLDSFFESRYEF